jgi:hypothetical protein
MADDLENIKITFDTNADDVKKSTDSLNASVEKNISTNQKLGKSNKDVKKTQDDVSKSSGQQKASFEDLGGGIGQAIQSVKGLSKAFLALLANPVVLVITAIVGAVTLLFKAFTSTKAGGEQLDRVMAGLGAVMDVLRDNVLRSVSAFKNLVTLNFKGLIGDLKEIAGSGTEIVDEFNKASEAMRTLQEVSDTTRELSVARAKLNRDLAESERILTDENATLEEKRKALEKVKDLEGKQTEQELANARKRVEAIQAQNDLSDPDAEAEALQALAEAQIALFDLEKKSAEDRRKISEFNKRIDGEEKARKKEIADQARAQYEERKKQREQEQKEIEEFNKSVKDKEAELLKQLQDLQDETDQQRLDRQRKRDLAEIEALRKKGADVSKILETTNKIYLEKQNDLNDKLKEIQDKKDEEEQAKRDAFLKQFEDNTELNYLKARNEAEIEEIRLHNERLLQQKLDAKIAESDALGGTEAERLEREQLIRDEFNQNFLDNQQNANDAKIAQEQALQQAIASVGDNAIATAKNIFAKNKEVQKGIILAEGGVALGKVAVNTVEAVKKSNAASPLTFGMPWSGVHIATGITSASSIISSTQRALKAVGGGGSISAGAQPNVATARSAGVSATPQTGFQASSENQIATSISQAQTEQPPIRTYVVTSDVTTGQNLDDALIQENSF